MRVPMRFGRPFRFFRQDRRILLVVERQGVDKGHDKVNPSWCPAVCRGGTIPW